MTVRSADEAVTLPTSSSRTLARSAPRQRRRRPSLQRTRPYCPGSTIGRLRDALVGNRRERGGLPICLCSPRSCSSRSVSLQNIEALLQEKKPCIVGVKKAAEVGLAVLSVSDGHLSDASVTNICLELFAREPPSTCHDPDWLCEIADILKRVSIH